MSEIYGITPTTKEQIEELLRRQHPTTLPTAKWGEPFSEDLEAGCGIDITSGTISVDTGTGLTCTSGNVTLETPVSISHGGTGTTSTPSDGKMLIGGGTGYSVANLTAGSGIVITNASGSVTISTSGGGGTSYTAACGISITSGAISVSYDSSLNCVSGQLGVSGGVSTGITSLNTLTPASQTMIVGSGGSDFTITSSGSVHKFDLPAASPTSRGVITSGSQYIGGDKLIQTPTRSGTPLTLIGQSGGTGPLLNMIGTSGGPNLATFQPGGQLTLPGGIATTPPLTIGVGVEPTTPALGQIWNNTSGIFFGAGGLAGNQSPGFLSGGQFVTTPSTSGQASVTIPAGYPPTSGNTNQLWSNLSGKMFFGGSNYSWPVNLSTATTGSIDLTSQVTGVLPVANGGDKYQSVTTVTVGGTITGGTGLYKVTVNYTDIQVAVTVKTLTLFTLPAGALLRWVKGKHSTAFAGGGGLSTCQWNSVGYVSPNGAMANPNFSMVTAVSKTNGWQGPLGSTNVMPSHSDATTTVTGTFQANVNLSNLTAGVLDLWFDLLVMS